MRHPHPTFQDHFAPVAGAYADYRPTYPAGLFEWLANQVPGRRLAWDCACGSGQASVDLARHFDQVWATDASAAQLRDARPDPRVAYHEAPAEASGLADATVDLVTVAQALHWFDRPRFYAEARRVLKPGGVLAVWTYGVQRLDTPAIDALVQHFYRETVGPYWPPERAWVESGYQQLEFPFAEWPAPAFAMTADWSLSQLLGYFASWSATGRYRQATGEDPVAGLAERLTPVWGDPAHPRTVTWPLAVRVGRA